MDVVIFGEADISFVMSDDKDFAYLITRDKFGNELRYEDTDGVWYEKTYNKFGYPLSYVDDLGQHKKWTRDENGTILKYNEWCE